jgi:hypothetical protein
MIHSGAATPEREGNKGAWGDIFRDGRHRGLQRAPRRPRDGERRPGRAARLASALASVRALGTAFGAAIAGVVANAASLGDATEPEAVGRAVTAVYMFCWIPFGLAAVFMLRFLRVAVPRPAPLATTAD